MFVSPTEHCHCGQRDLGDPKGRWAEEGVQAGREPGGEKGPWGWGGAGDTCAASGLEFTLSWRFAGNFVRVPLPCAHRELSEAASLLAKKLFVSINITTFLKW